MNAAFFPSPRREKGANQDSQLPSNTGIGKKAGSSPLPQHQKMPSVRRAAPGFRRTTNPNQPSKPASPRPRNPATPALIASSPAAGNASQHPAAKSSPESNDGSIATEPNAPHSHREPQFRLRRFYQHSDQHPRQIHPARPQPRGGGGAERDEPERSGDSQPTGCPQG